MKNYKALIFDFDGTIIDSLGDAAASFHHALAEVGVKRTLDEIKKYFGMGADRIFFHLLQDQEKALVCFDHYKRHQKQAAAKMPIHSGIADLLVELEKNSLQMAIVTGRHSDDLEIAIERHNISSYFSVVVCDNHLQHSKPYPDGLLLALDKLRMKSDEVMYVGDSIVDIQAARAAGISSIAALWDKQSSREYFAQHTPDHWADHPRDIVEILLR